ncbi:MAG: transglutaminase domain-containing protein [Phycisphaerae bacterium]|jgi:hypothetical protein|nr:transglutaminase domain-containing protein [Phycisphaerae bacterium]
MVRRALPTFAVFFVAMMPALVAAQDAGADRKVNQVIRDSISLLDRYLAVVDRSEIDIDVLAKKLGKDVGKNYAYVAETIRNQAYRGALRGPVGCLRSGAGNSVDKSLLLNELLTRAGLKTRLVIGTASDELIEDIFSGPRVEDVYRAELDFPYFLDSPKIAAERKAALKTMHTRLTGRLDSLRKAFGKLEKQLPTEKKPLPGWRRVLNDARQHVWVQVEQKGKWVDLDPSCLWAEVGERFAKKQKVVEKLPEALWHTVEIRGITESFKNGKVVTKEIFSWKKTADQLSGRAVILDAGASAGGGVGGLAVVLGGDKGYPLVLRVDGKKAASGPVDLRQPGKASGGLGGLGALMGDSAKEFTVAVGAEIVLESPGRKPVRVRRYLVDRWGFASRAAGDLAVLKKLKADKEVTNRFLRTTLCFSGEVAAVNPAYLQTRSLEAALQSWRALSMKDGKLKVVKSLPGDLSLRLLCDTYYHFSDRFWETLFTGERYTVAPRMTMAKFVQSEKGLLLSFDITHEAFRYLPGKKENSEATMRYVGGIVASIAEEEITTDPLDPKDKPAFGTARAFQLSGQAGPPKTVAAAADIPSDIPAALRTRLGAAIKGGSLVILPAKQAPKSVAWYELGLANGSMRPWMGNGLHNSGEYTTLTGGKGEEDTGKASTLGNAARGVYRCVAKNVDTVLIAAVTQEVGPEDAVDGAQACVTNAKDGKAARKAAKRARKAAAKRAKKAKRNFNKNEDFQRWFHKDYKSSQGMSGGGRNNPDMPWDKVADAWDEWISRGRPLVD